ncbi:hypothetical protein BH11BAC6_BH11BAC6_00230 [soil metagenome]
MDRKITKRDQNRFSIFKNFEYLDLFPYSIALVLLLADIYILNTFLVISHNMNSAN